MNVADALINLITFCVQNFLLPLLPSQFPAYTLAQMVADLAQIEGTIVSALSGWGAIFPVLILILFLIIIMVSELALFTFKIIKFAINVIRGSGA